MRDSVELVLTKGFISASSLLIPSVIVPPLWSQSGGHATLFRIANELERRGHRCSVWIHAPDGSSPGERRVRGLIQEGFAPVKGDVRVGLEQWKGAQVAIAGVGQLANSLVVRIAPPDHDDAAWGRNAERPQ